MSYSKERSFIVKDHLKAQKYQMLKSISFSLPFPHTYTKTHTAIEWPNPEPDHKTTEKTAIHTYKYMNGKIVRKRFYFTGIYDNLLLWMLREHKAYVCANQYLCLWESAGR